MKPGKKWAIAVGVLTLGACTSGELTVQEDASIRDSSRLTDAPGDASSKDGSSVADSAVSDATPSDAPVESGGPDVDRTDPQLHEFVLDPKTVDSAASTLFEDQYAQVDTRSEPLGKLVIFLPGHTNVPRSWRDHGRKLAEFGFHVIIPHYNNAWTGDICNGQGSDCNMNTRWEALSGEEVSPVVDIVRADSAEGRVLSALKYLDTEHPGGDWGYYLNGEQLRGERVIISGISHGATSSGLYAQRRQVTRAVLLSGAWGRTSDSQATPVEDYYGFSHTDDDQHSGHLAGWEALGLPGEPTRIDGQVAPFGNAHRLITSEYSTYPHCSVAVHSSSPVNGADNYIFEGAWRHLYGAP